MAASRASASFVARGTSAPSQSHFLACLQRMLQRTTCCAQQEAVEPDYEQPRWPGMRRDRDEARYDAQPPNGSIDVPNTQRNGQRAPNWLEESYESVEDWL